MSSRKKPELCSDKSDCMGCGACAQLCPTKAIWMQPDEEGFFYPRIEENQCVYCFKCLGVCPLRQL